MDVPPPRAARRFPGARLRRGDSVMMGGTSCDPGWEPDEKGEVMENSEKKRLLLAVDGSEQALEAVRYASRVLPPDRLEIVLFHVVTRVPESFWDLEKEPAYHYRIVNVGDWEQEHTRLIRGFMEQSRQLLLDAGVPEDAVTVKVQDRRVGIAQDIIAESQCGYHAVVVGRRGLSELKDFVLGSIANRLVEKLAHVPVWVVGGKHTPARILLCVDGSDNARLAVEYVGGMLGGDTGLEVTVFHVIRGLGFFQQMIGKPFSGEAQKAWTEKAEKELAAAQDQMNAVLDDLRRRLINAGLDPGRVTRKVATGATSRATAIIEEAERGKYDTIVVGRRGISMIQEFFMGRVSNKVIQQARDRIVWVVS